MTLRVPNDNVITIEFSKKNLTMTEKLQKVLARAGLGSRRQIETWISAGRVSVDGVIAKLGDRVGPDAKIRVDGKLMQATAPLSLSKIPRVLLYHKPEGEICSRHDPERRPTVYEHLPHVHHGRWVAVGRLDINTMGLLLFTNDGELANRLMHPSFGVERQYAVRILGKVDDEMLERLLKGVMLDDGKSHFISIDDAGGEGANHWYHVVLQEGKNRLVRRLWESQGVKVSRLIRLRYGSVALPRSVRPGKWVELEPGAVKELMSLVPIKK